MNLSSPCLCGSNLEYQHCCEPFHSARIHIISATPFKRVRWYSFRQPKQKTKEVSNENNIYPSNPRRTIPYLHRA
ncbi:MAG: hypothetical protein D0531_08885 [Methylococcales bacterium]|nr:MAG: hypothetical protein D0531_08885 [Methylococcales bacterium]